ncbi:MAG: hypothetical protein A3G34_03185 [Candidatus Lindowbacteria bacterium RIFCSPLOWO2_12_FULL_62_27]|nr:MAG: hypothetical protein A3I06_08230 [Candidatus Lindowbacteria bacterium RIFCSPLOWO2_02_FULL_62_12]OGH59325.1 MAG: hypothetical protein A3G34_03185 [Candidatus Lindowbacteria bacterium RIFCSPLOWO2_12_FULL_62_27]
MEAKVKLVGLDAAKRPVVILDCGERVLPIWVGNFEAMAISSVLSGSTPPRPMTHDTAINIIRAFSSKLDRAVVHKLENNTFFARLYVKRHDEETQHIKVVEIDCRPSDAIALSLRMEAPIFVSRAVLDAAGVKNLKVDRGSGDDAAPPEEEQ